MTERCDSVRLASMPDVLTVAEAARALRIGRNAAYEGIRKGEIPALKIGRRVLVPKARLLQLLAGGDEGSDGSHHRRDNDGGSR